MMKFLKLFFTLAMVMAPFAIALSANASTPQSSIQDDNIASNQTSELPDSQEPTSSIGGAGRFLLAQTSRAATPTCDKHPAVCQNEDSPGPFCCNKKCVDLMTDKFNCGRCGKKCGYSKICCQAKCVNPLSNAKHCGGCNNNCGKGNSCLYGMCSYA